MRVGQSSFASDSIFFSLGLCFSFRARFLFSVRLTGGGVFNTVRDAAFTMLVARNFFAFFFAMKLFNHVAQELDAEHGERADAWRYGPFAPLIGLARRTLVRRNESGRHQVFD